MVYRISAGLFFLLTAFSLFGVITIPSWATGVLALVAGIALLAGQ